MNAMPCNPQWGFISGVAYHCSRVTDMVKRTQLKIMRKQLIID